MTSPYNINSNPSPRQNVVNVNKTTDRVGASKTGGKVADKYCGRNNIKGSSNYYLSYNIGDELY